LGFERCKKKPLSRLESVLLVCSLSVVTASIIKDQLKFVFGRTWPETWVGNNPSLIHDGVYGFNPFHIGAAFRSFPSEHVTILLAVASVLWICYPKFRIVYSIAVAAVIASVIGANFHFLADCIAGAFVGASTGWIAVILWDTGRRPISRERALPDRVMNTAGGLPRAKCDSAIRAACRRSANCGLPVTE
jgi:membrane-associated phospholipid phosphatase